MKMSLEYFIRNRETLPYWDPNEGIHIDTLEGAAKNPTLRDGIMVFRDAMAILESLQESCEIRLLFVFESEDDLRLMHSMYPPLFYFGKKLDESIPKLTKYSGECRVDIFSRVQEVTCSLDLRDLLIELFEHGQKEPEIVLELKYIKP